MSRKKKIKKGSARESERERSFASCRRAFFIFRALFAALRTPGAGYNHVDFLIKEFHNYLHLFSK